MINEGEGGSPSRMAPPRKVSKQDAIVDALSCEITEGAYSPDIQLPTEAQLCERFGASHSTIGGALGQLEDAGPVTSVRERGWYVRNDSRHCFPLLVADEHDVLQRDSDAWRNWLRPEGLTATSELTVSISLPPRHVAEHLRLEPDAECVTRRRLVLSATSPS
jgi:DNA-binding GntR family transcriptional regulator